MGTTPQLRAIDTGVNVDQLLEIDKRATLMLEKVRDAMLAPYPAKEAPTFTSTGICNLCGIDRARLNYAISKGELPAGDPRGVGRSRHFTLAETRQWIRAEAKLPQRPAGVPGTCIVMANFKGGSNKTTTTFSLAQGLTLRGHRVLVVDMDPQGSLTSLCGLLPEKEVFEEHTVMPLVAGDQSDLRYAVRETYWDGLAVIPAMPSLFAAEFHIPSQVISKKNEPGWQFWNIIANGLTPLREEFDVILLDTAPALSYLTINAMMAGDGLIMPLPPRSLDYASSTQFWSLFGDLVSSFRAQGFEKRYDFVSVLLSSVASDAATPVVRNWILDTYQQYVLTVEIPNTTVVGTTSAAFSSVYDVTKWEGSNKTYQRARQAYDGFVDQINEKLAAKWRAE